ncbi:MAG: GNAT family N-acetyltransferase, partial [Sedimentisphaerales bacterium]|nr:GNAT family N-acetyltransferase [Sedimentisphaerales bacterium]
MLRIRTIHNTALPVSRQRLGQVKEIFRAGFPDMADYADQLDSLLANPFKKGYQAAIIVAETGTGRVKGFCLMLHFPQVHACWLDFLAVRAEGRGGGFGGALYEAAREYAQGLGAHSMWLEVTPDDSELTSDEKELANAKRRMRFYEHYGARPVLNAAYARPVGQPPTTAYLLFDGLGRDHPLHRSYARQVVHLIMTLRFGHVVDPTYARRVLDDFKDDPVPIRPARYIRKGDMPAAVLGGRLEKAFALVSSGKHVIHHVRQRGYFEQPTRVGALVETMNALGIFSELPERRFAEDAILAVHDRHFVEFLKAVCLKLSRERPVYPDTFPVRKPERRPKINVVQAGYYCIDSCTPLDGNAYTAARASVDVALTAMEEILSERRVAYAVCRPPGHHAERSVYGGFCYFNNAAIAAHRLSQESKVAILDIDFHHGNGTQDIFYRRDDVLTVSIHGHPDEAFPYFSGFAHETGTQAGLGFNLNLPLPAGTGPEEYL